MLALTRLHRNSGRSIAWQCFCLLAFTVRKVNSQCAYTVGVDGNTWGNETKQIWNMTFEQYLSAETGCTFSMTLFSSPDQFVSSGLDGSVDLFFAGPGVFVCLQSRIGTVPLVSLINEWHGEPLQHLGAAAVALASRTDLQTLKDVENQRLTMSGISTLTSGQAQWRELSSQGYNPFLLASQVKYIQTQLSFGRYTA